MVYKDHILKTEDGKVLCPVRKKERKKLNFDHNKPDIF